MAGLLDTMTGWASSPATKLRRARRLIDAGERHAEAFPLLAKAANAGIAEAEYLVGRAYLEGAGVPPSGAEAARWLERAANRGYLDAQSMLAALYIHGVATSPGAVAAPGGDGLTSGRPAAALFSTSDALRPDFERAVVWARRAAAGGHADGQALLAYILTSGPDELRDLEQAEELYRRSAAADCPQGCLGFALALLRKARDARAGDRSRRGDDPRRRGRVAECRICARRAARTG